MNEATFQRQVEEACTWHGVIYYHTFDSRHSAPGFPDMVIVGRRGVIFRELKTQTGRLTAHQRFWLEVLTAAGEDAAVWRPSDMRTVVAELRGLGRVTVQKPAKPVPKMRRSPRTAG